VYKRDGAGRFVKGTSAPPPSVHLDRRPPARVVVSRTLIAEATRGGRDIIETIRRMLDDDASWRARHAAAEFLADRLWGRPIQATLTAHVGGALLADALAALPADALTRVIEATAEPVEDDYVTVIDATATLAPPLSGE